MHVTVLAAATLTALAAALPGASSLEPRRIDAPVLPDAAPPGWPAHIPYPPGLHDLPIPIPGQQQTDTTPARRDGLLREPNIDPNSYYRVSCYEENFAHNKVLGSTELFAWDMTQKKCGRYCINYNYFGISEGTRCACSNIISPGSYQYIGWDHCDLRCPGNLAQTCGGILEMEVFAWRPKMPSSTSSVSPSQTSSSSSSSSSWSSSPPLSSSQSPWSSSSSSTSPDSLPTWSLVPPSSSSSSSTSSSSSSSSSSSPSSSSSNSPSSPTSSSPSSSSSSSSSSPSSSPSTTSSSSSSSLPSASNPPTDTSSSTKPVWTPTPYPTTPSQPTSTAYVPYIPGFKCSTFEDQFDATLPGTGQYSGQSPVKDTASGVLYYAGFDYISDSFHQTLLPPPSLPNAIGTGSSIFGAETAAIHGKNATTWFGVGTASMACGLNTGYFVGFVETCTFRFTGTRADGSVVAQDVRYDAAAEHRGYKNCELDAGRFYALRKVDVEIVEASKPREQVMLLLDNVSYGACYMQ